MEPYGALTADGCGLDGSAIFGHHQQRDHPGLREIDLINLVTGLINSLPLRQKGFLEIAFDQFKQLARQGREQSVVLMAQHRTVGQRGSSLPLKGNRRRTAAWPATIPVFPCPRARLSSAVVSFLKRASLEKFR